MNNLQFLLNPQSIAILGASADLTKVNGRTLKYLVRKGYAGRIFPVNPKYSAIGDLKCYPEIAAVPERIDLAIIALPAPSVAGALRELGKHGVKAAIIFSSGFAEVGEQGRALEDEAMAAARESGVCVCGPNCLGLVNAFDNVIATFGQFADGETPPGPVGFVSQSGAFGTAIAALARSRGLGLGYFVNTGNEGGVTFAQVMRAVLEDPRIRVGAGYIEGLKDGPGVLALAEFALQTGKPLVLTKVGKTGAGARAVASHTGALAGEDKVFDGIMRSRGVIRARNEEHMLDVVDVLARCGLPEGRGLGIITQSGGAGVLMADRAEELGLQVPLLLASTQRALKPVVPGFGSVGNPVDITGQFVATPQLLRDSVRLMLTDPGVHVGIVWLQLMDAYVDELIEIFRGIRDQATKPVVICWVAAPQRALIALRALGLAVLRGAEPAVDAVAALMNYADARRRHEHVTERPARPASRLDVPAGVGPAAGVAVQRLLNERGIRTAATELTLTSESAVAAARKFGYPVAVKIESRDIPHKTEAQGVQLGLKSAVAVKRAFHAVIDNAKRYKPGAKIDGVVVQAMARGDVELVIGLKHDPVFGVVVMAGLGGIHIEVLKDVAFRKAPVTPAEAELMLGDLRGGAILNGVRGKRPVNRAAVAEMISAVSEFGVAVGDRLVELDLNPVLAGTDTVMAVDWLLVLR